MALSLILRKLREVLRPASCDLQRSNSAAPRRVLVVTEHVNATYYLSFHYVFEELHRRGELAFTCVSSRTAQNATQWRSPRAYFRKLLRTARPNVVVFTRYGEPHSEEFLAECRRQNLPTVYHIDDNLMEIPPEMPPAIVRRHETAFPGRQALLEGVDLIYASTPTLADQLTKHAPRQPIVHGIYAPDLQWLIDKPFIQRRPSENGEQVVGYMGSAGHKHDLELITPALVRLLERHQHIRFETFGTITMPAALEPFGNRVTSHGVKKSYAEFLSHLYHLNWDLGLAPLEDHRFNRCKACTKFVEYTSCEIPTLASNSVVYDRVVDGTNGMLADEDEWESCITGLLAAPTQRASMLKAAQATCQEQFALSLLERQVLTVLDQAQQLHHNQLPAAPGPRSLEHDTNRRAA